MNDQVRRNSELIEEISALRLKIRELEKSESERKRTEKLKPSSKALSRGISGQELLEEEKRLHDRFLTVLDSIDATIYVADIDSYEILFMNKQMKDSFGGDFTGKKCWQVFRNEVKPCSHCTNARLLDESGNPAGVCIWEGRNPITGKWYNNYDRAIRWVDGRIVRLQTATDITDRKRIEESLRESEKRFRELAELMPETVYETNVQGTLTFVNRNAFDRFGYTPQEFEHGLNAMDIVVPEDHARALENLQRVLNGENIGSNEYTVRRKDGSTFHAMIHSTVIINDGKASGLRGFIVDISEQKQTEEALKSSLSLLSASLESTADGILIVDRKGKIARWNRKFADMWKIPKEILSGRDDEKALNHILTQLADPEQFIAKVKKLYEQPEESSFDQIEFADGRVFERYSQPQRIEDNIVGRVWSFRDITERKRAEKEKAKLEEQYRQAQKMEAIGQLAGGVAHDFNNMLNIILGYSQLALLKSEPSSPISTNIQEIMNAAKRSASLVRQLLAFARKQTIAPKALDLNDTIAGMLNMLRKLIGEDIDLIWMPAANLWPVKMDPAQIDQILANLAVNARDSISGVGRITIETGKAEFDKESIVQYTDFVPGQYVLLAVSDNGCGMDKETCEQIFEPFFTTKEIGKGTGMGLATVYGIVKQNHGFINVYSDPGKGTTFKVYLPRFEEEGAAIGEPGAYAETPTGTETVLLVEDDEALLKLGKMMLEALGYTVLAAGSPNEAIKLTEQHTSDIHLVLTDVIMPEMSGRDLQRRLSTLRPDFRFLFMSGYTANVIAHRGILDEGIHFLQKPFHMEVLAAKVREALNRP